MQSYLLTLSFAMGFFIGEKMKRLAVIAIIIEDIESSAALNELLHEYRDMVVGRMGIPYRERQVSVLSLVVDATSDEINALTGRLGRIPHVKAKAVMSK